MAAGRHWENDWLIGPGKALDPAKYFIIVTNMFGNGLSSSPSNTPPPFDRARFPQVISWPAPHIWYYQPSSLGKQGYINCILIWLCRVDR